LTKTAKSQTRLEEGLGHRFRDRTLLQAALTPPFAGKPADNQRLEFLGDSVLHICASLMVYREHPTWAEGALSKLRGMLVCADALHAWALDLGVTLERGPRSSTKPLAVNLRNPLADAMEALLAAVFLDVRAQGGDGLATVQVIVEGRFLEEVRRAYAGVWEARDTKTTLQEKAAALALPPPVYEELERQGPDHAPTFTVRVLLAGREAVASASNLKRAQAEAARVMLQVMEETPLGGSSS